MARRDEDYSDESAPEHPALKGHSRTGSQVKHVAGGTFKGALIGGAVGAGALGLGAAALGGMAIVAGGPFTLIPAAVAGFMGIGTSFAASAVTAAAVTGGTYGAALGAGAGGLFSLTGAGDAADAEEDKIINKYEQAMARKDRMERLRDVRDRQAMAMARQESQMRGMNPNQGLPRGRGDEGMAIG